MATRTNDLTEFAKPSADRLAARCGSLKRVLSAGIMALDALSAEEREIFMSKAIGAKPIEHSKMTKGVQLIKEYVEEKRTKSSTRFVLQGKEDQAALNELRKVLGPDLEKLRKRKA